MSSSVVADVGYESMAASAEAVGVAVVGAAFLGAAVGVGAIGAVGYGTAMLIKKMHADYGSAQAEFEKRQMELSRELAAANVAHVARKLDASRRGAAVDVSSVTSDLPAFLVSAVRDCFDRAKAAGRIELAEAAKALAPLAKSGDTDVLTKLDELYNLLDEEIVAVVKQSLADDDWANLVDLLRRDLSSPVLATSSDASFRAEAENEISKIEKLPKSERAVAIQGLEMLRTRIRRETRLRIKSSQAKVTQAAEFRAQAGEALACFRAVAAIDDLPELKVKARRGAEDLQNALTDMRKGPERVKALAKEARALFDEAQQTLRDRAATERVYLEIAGALMEMGYSVSAVQGPDGPSCHVAVQGGNGVSISVDTKGSIRAEMVAYDSSASEPTAANEEEVCKVVDQLFQALRQREIPIRERTRKRRKSSERLRVIERPQTAVTPAVSQSERKALHVDH